ncbi:MAG TPA: HRDC domain-containing protein, partial [Longimicrobiales bacterium]|nr:HRDC domain-containing protein [Longimicrobiales bacterium]
GLASLLETHLDVRLSKKYQRADWARRPLPDDMLEYAAADTDHLFELADLLAARLREKGRLAWAEEEYRQLEGVRFEDDGSDPVTRVKGARDLDDRDVTALREALEWRDRIARAKDRAPFRVVGDRTLLAAAQARPRTVDELADIKGMNGSLARSQGEDLLERLRRVEALGPEELRPYPRFQGNGRGRPPPEVEDRLDRLKALRNQRAEELGMSRGTLLPNQVLLEIARAAPDSRDGLRSVPGVRAWQVEALGKDLLERVPA